MYPDVPPDATTVAEPVLLAKQETSVCDVIEAASCVPLTTQRHVVLLNVAVCQHARVGWSGWSPITTHSQKSLSNSAVS